MATQEQIQQQQQQQQHAQHIVYLYGSPDANTPAIQCQEITGGLQIILQLNRVAGAQIEGDENRLVNLYAKVNLKTQTHDKVNEYLAVDGQPVAVVERMANGRENASQLTPGWRNINFVIPSLQVTAPGWYYFEVMVLYYPPDGGPKVNVATVNGPFFGCYTPQAEGS